MTEPNHPPRPAKVRGPSTTPTNVAPTPTQEIVAAGTQDAVEKTDTRGRALKIRKLSVVTQMRIARVLGAELSKNDTYKALASLAFCVIAIDGEAVASPVNVREVEFMIERLGEDGVRTIGAVYKEQGWSAQEDESGVIEDAKN